MEKRRLERIEQYIFDLFRDRKTARLLTRDIFESTHQFANADLVRAFEDLEKKWRLLIRYTREGNDWVSLTPEGLTYAGLTELETDAPPEALPHPPKSAT